ncbi:MAG: hypothetical protein KJP07_05040, partial [Desulfatitalea sp.]|nr:hypothetical protein [Desulfatitalea sp.]
MKKKHSATFSSKSRGDAGRGVSQVPADDPGPRTLAAIFERCGMVLTQRQIDQFWLYHGLLRHHNTTLNLTRIHNFTNMVLKLYVDAALPAQLT